MKDSSLEMKLQVHKYGDRTELTKMFTIPGKEILWSFTNWIDSEDLWLRC